MTTEERLKGLRLRGRVDAHDGVNYDTSTLSHQEREAYYAGYHGVTPNNSPYEAIGGVRKNENKKSNPVRDFIENKRSFLLFCIGVFYLAFSFAGAFSSVWAGVAVFGLGFIFLAIEPLDAWD